MWDAKQLPQEHPPLPASPEVLRFFLNSLIHPASVCATGTPIILTGCLVKYFHPKILET